MTDEEFWQSVEATEEERIKGTYYLRERGLEEHFNVLRYLESFRSSSDKRITYSEIATVLRYDKRIRRCLFKYIGVVEERLRAHFLDFYRNSVSKVIPTKTYEKLLKIFNGDFYLAITHLMFGPFIQLFKKQEQMFKESVFGKIENLKTNLDALIALRNQVCHNKFLLNKLEFDVCKYIGEKKSSLYANIKNLYFFTDEDCKNGLIRDIKTCAFSRSAKYNNQVNWVLPKNVIVELDDLSTN